MISACFTHTSTWPEDGPAEPHTSRPHGQVKAHPFPALGGSSVRDAGARCALASRTGRGGAELGNACSARPISPAAAAHRVRSATLCHCCSAKAGGQQGRQHRLRACVAAVHGATLPHHSAVVRGHLIAVNIRKGHVSAERHDLAAALCGLAVPGARARCLLLRLGRLHAAGCGSKALSRARVVLAFLNCQCQWGARASRSRR